MNTTIRQIKLPPLAKFPLGQTVITSNAQARLNAMDVQLALNRHHRGDWGDMSECDKKENEHALIHAGRLMSSYRDSQGKKFWIITEWDRSVTTVLLPEDY
jgi:hypothetical protein